MTIGFYRAGTSVPYLYIKCVNLEYLILNFFLFKNKIIMIVVPITEQNKKGEWTFLFKKFQLIITMHIEYG